ncbi:OmpA family protein [uncultured Treponema sp.]|uniref:OmpA family protein n=1 Tax=uncultured Treponema sp. TaxID=162155 RepID=UPI00259AC0DA|nr:OmpA family protein [uncultured Treponema sp.]
MLVERTDLRRYDNGRYTGLVSREVRSFIAQSSSPEYAAPGDTYYDGSFYIIEATKRNSHDVKMGINESIPSSFRITSDGELVMIEDNGYPSFRSFPAFTKQKIRPGDKWQAKAERAVDPLNKGTVTKMPIYVEYQYLRDDVFNGEKVFVLSAKWATRYGISYIDFAGDAQLKGAFGSHSATMFVSAATGNALVVRDAVDETFEYADGNKISFKGTISLFTHYPPAVDRDGLIRSLARIADVKDAAANKGSESNGGGKKSSGGKSKDASDSTDSAVDGSSSAGTSGTKQPGRTKPKIESSVSKNMTVDETPAGLRLTIKNLQFKPDSAQLLPGEEERLDQIAHVLKQAREQMFLVEGHTASVGFASGEMKLSKERAHAIAEALVQRGIPAQKFICKGSGGTKPIADNSTPEGKALNRRVEITILE